jgi:hypothetical protein
MKKNLFWYCWMRALKLSIYRVSQKFTAKKIITAKIFQQIFTCGEYSDRSKYFDNYRIVTPRKEYFKLCLLSRCFTAREIWSGKLKKNKAKKHLTIILKTCL